MAYNILKHRRGTTREWLATDIVPEDGELIIEECSNGSRRCKIGNGYAKFSLLPYTDDILKQELLAEIDELTSDIEAKLGNSDVHFLNQINEATQSLESRFETRLGSLTNDYISRDSKLTSDINKNLEAGLLSAQKALQAGISESEERAGLSIEAAKADLKNEISTVAEELTSKIDSSSASVSATIDSLEAKLTQNLTTEISNREALATTVAKQIESLESEVETNIKTTVEILDNKISGLTLKTTQHDSDLGQLGSALENTNTEINQKISELEQNLDTEIQSAITTLDDKITKTSEEIYDKLDNDLKQLQGNLDNVQNSLNAEFSKLESSIENDIKSAITTVDARLTQVTGELNTQHQEDLTELQGNIDELETSIGTKLSSFEESLAEVTSPAVGLIDRKILEATKQLSDTHTADKEQLYVELANATTSFESKLAKQNDDFNSALLQTASEITSSTDNKISEVSQASQELVNILAQTHTKDLKETKETLENKISDSANETQDSISALEASLTKTDRILESTLAQLEEQSEQSFTSIFEQLSELVTKTKQLSTSDSSLLIKFSEISNRLSILSEDLATELAELKQKQNIESTYLSLDLSNLEGIQNTSSLHNTNMLFEYITKFYAELADLVDDDITILRKVATIDNTLTIARNAINEQINAVGEQIKAVDDRLTESLTSSDGTLNTEVAGLKKLIDDSIKELDTTLRGVITAASNTLTTNINTHKSETDKAFEEFRGALNELKTIIDDNQKSISDRYTTIEGTVTQTNAELTAIRATLNTNYEEVDTRIDELEVSLDVEKKRIDNIINPPEGGPLDEDPDRELHDIRVGYSEDGTEGIIYECAGDAVRAVGKDVKALRKSLSQYIDTQAIDGLYYDTVGEVGVMQPYMLYLKAKDEVIPETGVKIISGAGGGGGVVSTSTLTVGYITKSPLVVNKTDQVDLVFTFSGKDGSGDEIQQANAEWSINGEPIEYGTVTAGENHFDATKYLSVGTTTLLLKVTDDVGLASPAYKSWSIQQIDLAVESSFNDKATYTANEEILFTYTPTGAIEKTAVFVLDGEVIKRLKLSSDISGIDTKTTLPAQKHGSHLLEFYLEATINNNPEPVFSEPRTKDILWYDPNDTTPIIGTPMHSITMKQYSTTPIVYTVYQSGVETPEVTIMVDEVEVSKVKVKPNPDYNDTPTDTYTYAGNTPGTHTIKFICGETTKEIIINVEKLGIEIAPITEGLVFDFNPTGFSNGDTANRLWQQNGIKLSVSDNFDWTNGGYKPDDPDGPCFCVKAGSTATIDYKLFADDAKKYGKEFKLIFKTANVSNPDATFLRCIDNTTANNHIGISMGVHEAIVCGQNGRLNVAYSENDLIEFEFNISTNTEKVLMVMCYEDGVPTRPMIYDDSYNFTQTTPKDIEIGSPDCDVYIYRLKVYNTSLSNVDILNNFIADARTAEDMIARYNRNQIYDENHKLTPETLAEKCPWLRVYKISAPHFTNNKSDKVSDSTIQQIYKKGDPVLDNWTCYNAQHSGQGTSSNNYGAAGRNLDFIMNTDGAYFKLGDNKSTAHTITLTRQSVPVAYLNAKVNIASSNNLTNAILANKYNKFNPYRRPFTAREGINLNYIKDTMEFHNCVIFIRETDPDFTTHREFADNEWHFYAIGNIGDSKKTDNTRATDPSDPYECCVEIMDVGLPLSDFPTDTMYNAMSYKEDETTHERTYTWAKNENLGILYEKINGEYVLTEDTEVDLNKTYYVDILEHDDFSEDYTYGWRYRKDKKNKEATEFCRQKWIEFYRFVTTSSDDDFKNKLSDYFVVDSALYYYLFTTRYCMVDNRAKNTFWHYGKTTDGTYKWDLCWDYDNDTSLGLNNYGKQVYRYGLEDTDKDESGEEVFRESDSQFFCRLRDLFGAELKAMYKDLESKNAWHAESFLNECDAWQEEFPEELWRIDIDRKYLRTYTSSFINGKGDSQFLVNMCNGRMKYQRRQWERSQEQYMASKYQTSLAYGDNYHANFRVNRFDSDEGLIIKPNYQLTLTAYSHIYLNVWYGDATRTPYTVKFAPNETKTISCPPALEADIVIVGSASAIRDFGDLSACYPKTASVGNAFRIRTLTLGNSTTDPNTGLKYENNAFTTLTTGTNPLLEELNIENISSLNQSLDLSQLTNLKILKAFGTSTPSVTFANGGKIYYVELPAVNDITLKNLKYLSTENFKLFSYDNVTSLTLENCPSINYLNIFDNCTNLLKARLIDVNFGYVTYEYFANKIFGLKGSTATGEQTPDAILVGQANFEYLTGAQFNELVKRYPNLVINYDQLDSTITFMDTDLTTVVHQGIAKNGGDYRNPAYYEDSSEIPEDMIAKPTKKSTDEFTYQFIGWSTQKNVLIPEIVADDAKPSINELISMYKEDSVKAVEGDRTLYPVFRPIRREYPVHFINSTVKDPTKRLLQTVMVPHGSNAVYTGATPRKEDAGNPANYEHTGWQPSTDNIIGECTCYAQFTLLDSVWYTLGLSDINYTLNNSKQTLAITKCNNQRKENPAQRIPNSFDIDEIAYTVATVGGFDRHSSLELIKLPDTLKAISNQGFWSCQKLYELTLPESLETIGSSAFKECAQLLNIRIPTNVSSIGSQAFMDCSKITSIHIPAKVNSIGSGALACGYQLESITVDEQNQRFKIIDNCLVNISTKTLLKGLDASIIPAEEFVENLDAYCFYRTNIQAIDIPEHITSLPGYVFSWCKKLTEVTLPTGLKSIGATCFSWCENLKDITLPDTLTTISTYTFNKTAFEDVVIPALVGEIPDHAFGETPTLKTVTFKKRLDAQGNIIVPKIDPKAFYLSGSNDHVLEFYLPWDESDTPDSKGWGAKNYNLNFNYVEEDE